jgi:hypothetical protein
MCDSLRKGAFLREGSFDRDSPVLRLQHATCHCYDSCLPTQHDGLAGTTSTTAEIRLLLRVRSSSSTSLSCCCLCSAAHFCPHLHHMQGH